MFQAFDNVANKSALVKLLSDHGVGPFGCSPRELRRFCRGTRGSCCLVKKDVSEDTIARKIPHPNSEVDWSVVGGVVAVVP